MNKLNTFSIIALALSLFSSEALSERIDLVISADLMEDCLFAPVVLNLETGNRIKFSEKEFDKAIEMADKTNKSIWPLNRKLLGKRCRVYVHEFGKRFNEVAWKEYDINDSLKEIVFPLREIRFNMIINVDTSKYTIGKMFKGTVNSDGIDHRIRVRFRRIDEVGGVCISDSVQLNKKHQISVFQEGVYVVDIIEYVDISDKQSKKLFSENDSFGYPIWAKKVKISKDTRSIELNYDEMNP